MAALQDTSTRDRLLTAAVEVFVEQGYEGARLQDIARAAGLTTGAVYANFRGKDELLFAAIGARAGIEVDALLAEALGREPREFLELLGDQLVRPRRQPPLLIDAVAAARRDDQLAAALRSRCSSAKPELVVATRGRDRVDEQGRLAPRAHELVAEELEELTRLPPERLREQRVDLDAGPGADCGEQQLVLAPEVGVHGPRGQSRGPGDVLQPGTFVALLDEHLDRRGEQAIPGRRVLEGAIPR